MALTRLDCDLFRGGRSGGDVARCVACNPHAQPGRLAFVGSAVASRGSSSHAGHEMACESFLRGVQDFFDDGSMQAQRSASAEGASDEEWLVAGLERAFRTANSSVFGYAQRMGLGGSMAVSMLGVLVDRGQLSSARVGAASVYLFRNRQLFPFFEPPQGEAGAGVGDYKEFSESTAAGVVARGALGTLAVVDMDVASIALCSGDMVAAFSRPLSALNETLLFEAFDTLASEGFPSQQHTQVASRVCGEVFTEPDSLSFSLLLSVGQAGMFCARSAQRENVMGLGV